MDEHPRRGLIYGLRGRDERDTGSKEGFVNLHVVGAVTGEPVELMHKTELHTGRGDEREHLLKAVAICRPRRLSGVDELAHDPRTQLVGLAPVRLALRRDREALFGAAALGLLTSRDAQVGHRHQHRRFCGVVVGHARRRAGEGGSGRGAHAVLLSSSGSGSIVTRSSALPSRESVASSSGAGRSYGSGSPARWAS